MNNDSDFLFDLGECDHKPLLPPRDGVIGEHVYAEAWQQIMAQPSPSMHDDDSNYQLRQILCNMPGNLHQRHATVAATFIKWLGTNCGIAFLIDARRLEKHFVNDSDAYLAAWATDNMRRRWNGGYRTVEAILAPEDHWGANRWNLGSLAMLPELTIDDLEVIEHVVYWLGSVEGKFFVTTCEARTKRLQQSDSERRLREFADRMNNEPLKKCLPTERMQEHERHTEN